MKRILISAISIILQLLFFQALILNIGGHMQIVQIVISIISIIVVLFIMKDSMRISNDLPWIILILVFPIIGLPTYVLLGNNLVRDKTLRNINKEMEKDKKYFVQEKNILEKLKNDENKGQITYLTSQAGFLIYENNKEIKYYRLGEYAYKAMIEELKKAKEFIFLEYFIINKDSMWNGILEILKQKAKQGIEVRLLYDDMGTIKYLPFNYPKELEKYGIKCICFNRIQPLVAPFMNHRDHRKIMVIDGKVAFTGGMNLAEEYINKKKVYGHWKDNAIKIRGDAVWSFTVFFLEMWNALRKEDTDFTKYKVKIDKKENNKKDGFLIPYEESPLDREFVGENVYINILNQSKNYVYIFTPYLIINNEFVNALMLASARGVDIKIIMPGIPDKKIVYSVSKSYFEEFIKAGIEIYTYTPRFRS